MAGKSKYTFDSKIHIYRATRRMTQQELAELLGIKPNLIGEMENGRKASTFAKLALMCEHYNVSADYLLGLTDELRPVTGGEKEP